MRGGSVGKPVWGPESLEWAYESLKVLTKYILSGYSAAHEIKHLWKFTRGFYWTLILREVSVWPWGPKAVLFLLAQFLLQALDASLQFLLSLFVYTNNAINPKLEFPSKNLLWYAVS
jgi:hypothetical protein